MVYDLQMDAALNKYSLVPHRKVFTKFNESINQITIAKPGDIKEFMKLLQTKLDECLDGESVNLNRSVSLEDLI